MARLAMLFVITLLAGCAGGGPPADPVAPASPAPARAESRAPKPKPPVIRYPARGDGEFRTTAAQDKSPAGGSVLRYRVLVEKDIKGVTPAEFAGTVQQTLADPRGWSAHGTRQFRRVGAGQRYDFTVYLVTPGTRDTLCQDIPDGYTSCRNGDRVVLNVARWAKGVPRYGASLTTYRQYVVNHEVGHRLGQGHELCPGPGEPAPVMQQQTLGLHGCEPNPWPYRGGDRYAGPPGTYDDEMPGPDQGR